MFFTGFCTELVPGRFRQYHSQTTVAGQTGKGQSAAYKARQKEEQLINRKSEDDPGENHNTDSELDLSL